MEKFNANTPVYLQVIDIFYMWVISGKLTPGDQIPPVRKLAIEWGVNPNTVQKALQKLEEDGMTDAQIGRGRYVTKNQKKLKLMEQTILQKDIQSFIDKMKNYNMSDTEIINSITNYLDNEGENDDRS